MLQNETAGRGRARRFAFLSPYFPVLFAARVRASRQQVTDEFQEP
jgi:hypothetical protein